jgi:DNA-binding transcriptional regulator YiaG
VNEIHRLWGQNIERGRRALDLSQVAFAELVGVTQQTVSWWEAGRGAPRDILKVHVAEILHQDVRQLFPLVRAAKAS